MKSTLKAVLLFLTCIFSANANVLVADFDNLSEGLVGTTIQDGGLTFSGLETYTDFSTGNLTIDNVSRDAQFASSNGPNCLLFGGYCPGPYGSSGRFGSMNVSFDGIASSVSMHLFISGASASQNILTLQAFRNGTVTAQTVLDVPDVEGLYPMSLMISDSVFDNLRLVASGPDQDGAVLMALDQVQVTLIPEPTALLLLGVGGLLIRKRS